MTPEEYWEKHVEIKGDGLDCGMCKSRFLLGWKAALKYEDVKKAYPYYFTLDECIYQSVDAKKGEIMFSHDCEVVKKCYDFIKRNIQE
jgi:hypothetical protein